MASPIACSPGHGWPACGLRTVVLLALVLGPLSQPVWPSDPEAPIRRAYTVPVDLSKRETYVAIPGSTETTRLLSVTAERLPSPYRLIPADGIVRYGQCVDIVLPKSPDVQIRLAIVKRGQELTARISPLIDIGQDDPVEFTFDRIKRTLWSFQRRVKDLQQQLTASRQEYQRIDAWLASPGNKPLYAHKEARLRQKILLQQIAAYRQELPAAQRRYATLRAIMELAGKIHATTEIRFVVSVGRGGS